MRKLLFILVILTMVSCCPTDNTETVKISSTRIDVALTGSYLYQFTYKGHDYITNYGYDFFYHIPSCPCHNKISSILDTDSSLEINY